MQTILSSDTATDTAVVAAAGTILVALISGLVSLLGLVISKEQKISDFRQAWIDALRQDTATLLANGNTICASLLVSPMSPQVWESLKENVFAIHELSAKIKLRLNTREEKHRAVQKILEAHDAEFAIAAGSKPPDPLAVVEIEKKLVADTQIVLKDAWNTVRDGESTYRLAKRLSITAIGAAIVALVSLGVLALWEKVHP